LARLAPDLRRHRLGRLAVDVGKKRFRSHVRERLHDPCPESRGAAGDDRRPSEKAPRFSHAKDRYAKA
jgi:hypothetical protein